jgi:hypothetical protein
LPNAVGNVAPCGAVWRAVGSFCWFRRGGATRRRAARSPMTDRG